MFVANLRILSLWTETRMYESVDVEALMDKKTYIYSELPHVVHTVIL